MFHLIVTFFVNVCIILILFLFILLVFLWAVGKQKAARQQLVHSTAQSAASAHGNPFAEGNAVINNNQPCYQRYEPTPSTIQNQYAKLPSSHALSPAVMPRRLSFSSSTTPPTPQFQPHQHHHQQHAQCIGIGSPSEIPLHAPKTPVMSMTPSRRVTFSLTPEQQQKDYDNRAIINLARRRAPTVVSLRQKPSQLPNDVPLVELFPVNAATTDDCHQLQRNQLSSYQYDRTRNQRVVPNAVSTSHPIRSLRQPPAFHSMNPFMPAPNAHLRQLQQQQDENDMPRPRGRPPPVAIP